MKTGIELISEERQRQIEKEGYTQDHDDHHLSEDLPLAAICYLRAKSPNTNEPLEWPWYSHEWKPKTRLRNLVRAGALVAAEIDRLQRLAEGVKDE